MSTKRRDHSECLVLAFQNGDEKGFDFIFRQYYTTLCFFANSIIHNEDEAKDIVQDCFVKLWDSQTINERSETIKSYLYTIVRNRCLDFLRKKKVIRKAELQIIKSKTDWDFVYTDEVAFAEMIQQIEGHIEELTSRMQKVIKLYYVEGKKYKQIASELNSSPEAVRKQKTRAIKIIRQKFFIFLSFF